MSELKQEILFVGSGLNTDIDKRYLKSGSSDYRLNCTYSLHGNKGIITNSLGNKLQSIDMPIGTNKVIGVCKDIENNAIIYLLYNSNLNHCILRYNIQSGTFNKVMWNSPILGFNAKEKINDPKIVNGWLWWCSKFNPPRHLHVERAISFTERPGTEYVSSSITQTGNELRCTVDPSLFDVGDIVYVNCTLWQYNGYYKVQSLGSTYISVYAPINLSMGTSGTITLLSNDSYIRIGEEELNIIRKPPMRRPLFGTFNDGVPNPNQLLYSSFQFAYNYIYNDDSYSVYSPISGICIPDTGSLYNPKGINPSADNAVNIWYERGSDEVKYINIIMRESLDTGWGEWKLIQRITRGISQEMGLIIFKNDFQYSIITDTVVSKSFDDVPDISNSMEIVGTTYLALGGNLINKTKTDVDISVSVSIEPEFYSRFCINNYKYNYPFFPSNIYTSTYSKETSFNSYGNSNYYSQRYASLNLNSCPPIGQILVLRLGLPPLSSRIPNHFGNSSIVISRNTSATTISQCWTILSQMFNRFNDFGHFDTESRSFIFNRSYNNNSYSFFELTLEVWDFISSDDPYGEQTESPNPTLKQGSKEKIAIVYTDDYRRNIGSFTTADSLIAIPYNTTVDGSNNRLFNKNNSLSIILNNTPPVWATKYQIYRTGDLTRGFYMQAQGFMSGEYLYIEKPNSTIYKYTDVVIGSINHEYTYEDGDRCRILLQSYDRGRTWVNNGVDSYDFNVILLESVADGTRLKLNIEESVLPNNYVIYEIYRSKKSDPTLFFEASQVYDIIDSDGIKVHEVSTINLYEGNAYRRLHNLNVGDVGEAFLESAHYSEFVKSDFTSLGRVSIEIDKIPTGIQNTIKISNKFVPNTQINGLCTFDWEETTNELNEKWGDIVRIKSVGDMLKVFQKNKITTFYVGSTALTNQDGSTNLMAIDSVLGKPREGLSNYGTVFGECVSDDGSRIYYYDIYNSLILRDGANGEEDLAGIGENSIYGYLYDKSIALLQSGIENISVLSFFDKTDNVVYFTFIDDLNPINNETIAYDEKTKSWIGFYSFIPELYTGINQMYTFKNGNLWEHGIDYPEVNRCSFYGFDYPMIVKIVANTNPTLIKTFDAISLMSNKTFDIEIESPPNENYRHGFYSLIKKAMFKPKEGIWFSAFNRNMKTTSDTIKRSELFSGDVLRGEYIDITMTNEDKFGVDLKQVNVKCSISSGTNV